jgi:putative toxin-antitoxin system antitoxin component (TIGR02293 family)
MSAALSQAPTLAEPSLSARMASTAPLALVRLEREGLPTEELRELQRRLGLPAIRLYQMLGLPKATAERRIAAGERIDGVGGQAAVGLLQLLAQAESLFAASTDPAATPEAAGPWLARWLELPQPALGGRAAAELLDTPTGRQIVSRLLGALESGAYQ